MNDFSRNFDNNFRLDLTGVEENGAKPIVAGVYKVTCEAADIKATKAMTGEYINCRFKVVGGDFEGSAIWHIFNIKNPSQQAVQIGLGQLKKYLRCLGRKCDSLSNTNDLLDGECLVDVIIEPNPTYGAKPKIVDFMPCDSMPKIATPDDKIPF
jgi:hypothetical protein